MTAVESIPSDDTLTRDLLVQVLAAMVRHGLENGKSAADRESLDGDTRPAAQSTPPAEEPERDELS